MRRIVWPLVAGAVALGLVLLVDDRPPHPAPAPAPAVSDALPTELPVALAALPDGGLAVGGQGGGVTILGPDGAERARWVAHGGPVRRVIPVEGELVTAGDGSVARWSMAGTRRSRLRLPEHTLNDAALAADGAVIVGAERGSVARIDGEGWHRRGTHGRATFAVAAAPDGRRVASGGADGAVAVWDLAGIERLRLRITEGWVTALAWTDAGLFVADSDGRLARWSVPAEGEPSRVWQATLAPAAIVGLAVGPDGALAGTEDGRAFRVSGDGAVEPVPFEIAVEPAPLSAVADGWLIPADGRPRRAR